MLEPQDFAWAQQIKDADKEDRVDFVYELQVKLRWFGKETIRDLAAVWGLGIPTIEDYAKQARRNVIKMHEEEYRERARAVFRESEDRIRYIANDALRNRKAIQDQDGIIQMVPDKKHNVALAAESILLRMYGVAAPTSGQHPATPGEGLDVRELDKLLEQGRKAGIIASPSPKQIETTGEAYEVEGIEVALPSTNRRRGSEERVHGGRSRRDRDPTGQGRGKGQAGG
jgi:hypothetical protein